MNSAVWVVSGLLAAAYLTAGILKTTRSKEALKPNMPWVEDFSPGTAVDADACDGLSGRPSDSSYQSRRQTPERTT